MVIDGRVVVEVKSTTERARFASRQLYNYLKSTSLEVGLLLHFGPDPCFFRLVHTDSQKQHRSDQ
jgi:GxxExxY protein